MTTLKIFCGREKPLTAVGCHQVNLLAFAEEYPSWHFYSQDRDTLRAIKGLVKRGSIVVNKFNQFHINMNITPSPIDKPSRESLY